MAVIQILFIGTNPEVKRLLQKGYPDYKLSICNSTKELDILCSDQPLHLIISTINSDFEQELMQINSIRTKYVKLQIPLLLFDYSAEANPKHELLAFESGASDYIPVGVNSEIVLKRINNQLNYSRHCASLELENLALNDTINLMDNLVLFMDRADNSFIIFNKDGEIDWVNEGFKRLYGYTKEEFKSKFGRTIFESSRNSEIAKIVSKCLETKKSVIFIAECQICSGALKWIQTTFTPIVNAEGEVERFIAIETDITKLKATEEALNQKNEYMLALTNHLKTANKLLEEQQKEINEQNKQLKSERKKSDDLLLNILPFEVARQLKSKGEAKPMSYKLASVLFLDFVNFTDIARELSPKDLIHALDSYFKAFDDIIDKHFIEKIKTIGDAYMCVGGLPLSNKSNPFNTLLAALEMQCYVQSKVEETKTPNGLEWKCKIGISTGELIAGVVGKKKYIYDVWGHTVNIAARMQEQGQKGRVNISEYTYKHISPFFECSSRGMIATKRGYNLKMYFVNRLKPEFSIDEEGFLPNEDLMKLINTL
jgi:PAS domain S-box-containing protein